MCLSYMVFPKDIRASPCAEVNSSSTVVPFGSAVTASCYIKEECSLTKTQDFLIKWKKNANFIPSRKRSQNVYEILISNFTDMQAVLECCICLSDHCQVVDAVEIRTACKDFYSGPNYILYVYIITISGRDGTMVTFFSLS